MTELFDALGRAAAEVEGMGKLTVVGVLLVVAKYSVDILRTKIVQRGLAGVEKMFKLPMGSLQWSAWSDGTRVTVSMAQSFLVGLLGGIASGMGWLQAAGAGVVAAIGSKGLHDSGLAPGRRPSRRGPAAAVDRRPPPVSPHRDTSLVVDLDSGKMTSPTARPASMPDDPTG